MRRRLALCALALLPLFVVGLTVVDPDGEAEGIVLSKDIMLPAPGPLGAVTVVGDSVLLGSGLWSRALPRRRPVAGLRAAVAELAGLVRQGVVNRTLHRRCGSDLEESGLRHLQTPTTWPYRATIDRTDIAVLTPVIVFTCRRSDGASRSAGR